MTDRSFWGSCRCLDIPTALGLFAPAAFELDRRQGRGVERDENSLRESRRTRLFELSLRFTRRLGTMFDLAAIQQSLREFGLDGWLLYDFRGSNVLARRVLDMESKPAGHRGGSFT